jgi:hypothetical protein
MELVTVFTALSPIQAQVIRAQLESAGFQPFVAHELSALSIEGYALAAGGIKVQVPEDQVEDALALIASNDEPAP